MLQFIGSGRCVLLLLLVLAGPAAAQLAPENVLLVYNSQQADSLAVRNLYMARHPGVIELDLNDAELPNTAVSRAQFVAQLRDPIRDFINGESGGPDLSAQIMALVLTRGIPARVNGSQEFELTSTFASVDSELTLLQQDLEQPGEDGLPFRYSGMVENPYHFEVGMPITGFTKALVKLPRTFNEEGVPGFSAWVLQSFLPGDMYLVTRLDAAPNEWGDELAHIEAMLDRSKRLVVVREQVQSLFDEYSPGPNQLDNDGVPPLFPAIDDFNAAAASLSGASGMPHVLHDQTANFITGPELADQCRPLLVLGSYGENHDVEAGAENPPGAGTYANGYRPHAAGMFVAYESFNGNSIVNGQQRADHQQALEFISRGGSFTIAHVNEPFTLAVADLDMLVRNLMQQGLSYAEAAWTAIPSLSWVNVAIGDPLARVVVVSEADFDFDGSGGELTVEDLYAWHAAPADVNQGGAIDIADMEIVRDAIRFKEKCGGLLQ